MVVSPRTTTRIALLATIALVGTLWYLRMAPHTEGDATGDSNRFPRNDWSIFSEVRTDIADTSTWRAYEDQRLGFRTKVPADWEVKPLPFPYEGADNFVMFKKVGDPEEAVIAELVFSYYWDSPYERPIEEVVREARERTAVAVTERGFGPSDYAVSRYTFGKYRVHKGVLPIIDTEGRWQGDKTHHYTVYLEHETGAVNSLSISLFSPQLPSEAADAVAHGILQHLLRIQ